ncbi:MAG TPA: hypothetical protein VLR26_07435, partial [Frankiaceae bacterium]|nr:hypothetical protein [Frankiaceae bacterium]
TTVLTPSKYQVLLTPNSPVTITGTAVDYTAIQHIEIAVYNTQTNQGLGANGIFGYLNLVNVPFQRVGEKSVNWSYTTPALSPGIYLIAARAVDNLGVTTPISGLIANPRTFILAVPNDAPPTTTLTSNPGTTQNLDSLDQTVTGTAADDKGVNRVALVVQDGNGRYVDQNGATTVAYSEVTPTLANPGATSTTWSYPLHLPGPGTYSVVSRSVDAANQYAWSTGGATAKWLIYPGDADPTLNVNSPLPNSSFTKVIGATGFANDDTGVAKVELQVQNGSQYMAVNGTFSTTPTWIPAYVTNPNGTRSNFNYNTRSCRRAPRR